MVEEGLRIALVIRVSTDPQEKDGESLLTQKKAMTEAVAGSRGVVSGIYGGSEHATTGWERKELERLLRDAKDFPRPFDAIMVLNANRWSRDNEMSKSVLRFFREAGIRFLTPGREYNLHSARDRFELGLNVELGEYYAAELAERSQESKIHRAERIGAPTCGKLPFGRTWNGKEWGIDEAKQAMIEDVANRYLAGESLALLAEKNDINHSYLARIFRELCGPTWNQTFKIPHSDEKKTIVTSIPALLAPETIKAVAEKAKASRTFVHKASKHKYLLSGYVYCGACHSRLTGQPSGRSGIYYRHRSKKKLLKGTICPFEQGPMVERDQLEMSVLEILNETFGNPAAVERALSKTVPNEKKSKSLSREIDRTKRKVEEAEKARRRILSLVARGSVTEDQAADELTKISDQQRSFESHLAALESETSLFPTQDEIQAASRMFTASGRKKVDCRLWLARHTDSELHEMSWEDKRTFVEAVFHGNRRDGSPRGLYIYPVPGQERFRQKRWKYALFGGLPVMEGTRFCKPGPTPIDGVQCVTRCVTHSPRPFPPEHHFRLRSLPRRREYPQSFVAWGRPSRVLWCTTSSLVASPK